MPALASASSSEVVAASLLKNDAIPPAKIPSCNIKKIVKMINIQNKVSKYLEQLADLSVRLLEVQLEIGPLHQHPGDLQVERKA